MKKGISLVIFGIFALWILGTGLIKADEATTYPLGTNLLIHKYKKPVTSIPDSSEYQLPSSYDWGPSKNNFLGRDICGPARDQGYCGSCWAFASVACFEGWVNATYGFSWIDGSEEVLVSDCCSAGDCGGGYLDQAADWMVNVGTTTEECWPYTASNGPCSGYCSDPPRARTEYWDYACGNWWTIDIGLIKDAIVYHGPLVTGMDVYSDFYGYSGGVYRHETGTYQGGHAVLLTGYVDDITVPGGGYFIAKNSWGTDWGPYGGYFYIAYDSNCSFGIESTYYCHVIVF